MLKEFYFDWYLDGNWKENKEKKTVYLSNEWYFKERKK